MDQPDQDKKEEEIKDLLEEDLELNKENNELLKGMHRSARWSLIFAVLKWLFILGSVFGIYYYFGQFFENTIGSYKELLGTSTTPTASSTGSFLDQVKNVIKQI